MLVSCVMAFFYGSLFPTQTIRQPILTPTNIPKYAHSLSLDHFVFIILIEYAKYLAKK